MNREEAINIVRKNIPHLGIGSTEMTEALKELIPELRESDDERIRQDIFKFIDEQYPEAWKAKKAKMLDWLEQQKEDRMKPIYDARESFESALEKAWNDYHNGYENVDKLEDDYVECAHAKGFREGYLFGIEKQKESFIDEHPNIIYTEMGEEFAKQQEPKPVEWRGPKPI